jgi:dUTP pyrophosphatase
MVRTINDVNPIDTIVPTKAVRELVDTGLIIQVPKNHCIITSFTKSGIAKNLGLTSALGASVVDEGYTGHVHVELVNLTRAPITIKKGQKIAQLLVIPVKYPKVKIVPKESIAGGSRGDNAFGSTGK